MKKFVLMVFCLLFAGTAFADWDPQDPAKWVQYPLLDGKAMAVGVKGSATSRTLLADDWQCSEAGAVSDIHIWGAASGDEYMDIDGVMFTLNIYSDIRPDPGVPDDYSRPGNLLWTTTMAPTDVVSDTDADKGWYEPYYGSYQHEPDGSAGSEVWLYNFIIEDPFIQDGSSIYWLGIDVDASEGEYDFGWMTSRVGDQEGFQGNDDAVYWQGIWKELRYPGRHWYQGESIDMAFVITPEPGTIGLLGLGGLAILRRRRKAS